MARDLIASLVPFQPRLERTFGASETLRVFARLFWESRDPSVGVTVTLAGRNSPPAQTLTLESTVTTGNRRQAELDTMMPLADLAPGAYVLRVSAKLGNGQTAVREIPIEIG
jgi:hypothetical protein